MSIHKSLKLKNTLQRQRSVLTRWERIEKLTPREREVMNWVVEGLTNSQVAGHLGISSRTVEAHRANLMAKTKTSSIAELVQLVMLATA